MTRRQFESNLESDPACSRDQLALVRAALDEYDRAGVLPEGKDAALYDVCPCRRPCWDGRAERPPADKAGITAPWIGANYPRRRILVIGINLAPGGGLDDHWTICRGHIAALASGKRHGITRSAFAYLAMTYADLLDTALDARVAPDWRAPDPRRLALTWQSCAFLEAVKCSPETERHWPYDEMLRECPPLMLQKEIAVLRPRVVLLLERGQARDAVRNMLLKNYGLEYGERYGLSDRPLERDTFRLAEREVELFCVNHPSTPNRTVVKRSLEELHESLHQHPLRAYETS